MIEEKEYSYETPWSASAVLIFFGMFVFIFGPVWAINNDAGVTVLFFELDAKSATIFYWFFVPIGLFLLLLGVKGNLERSKWKPYLAINSAGILFPVKPWLKKRKSILFKDIEDVVFRNIRSKEFLYIKVSGLTYVISEVNLKSNECFEEISQLIMKYSPQLQENINATKMDRENNRAKPLIKENWGALKRLSILTGIGVVVFIIVLAIYSIGS